MLVLQFLSYECVLAGKESDALERLSSVLLLCAYTCSYTHIYFFDKEDGGVTFMLIIIYFVC